MGALEKLDLERRIAAKRVRLAQIEAVTAQARSTYDAALADNGRAIASQTEIGALLVNLTADNRMTVEGVIVDPDLLRPTLIDVSSIAPAGTQALTLTRAAVVPRRTANLYAEWKRLAADVERTNRAAGAAERVMRDGEEYGRREQAEIDALERELRALGD